MTGAGCESTKGFKAAFPIPVKINDISCCYKIRSHSEPEISTWFTESWTIVLKVKKKGHAYVECMRPA
jgi:hypothetical protein